MSFIWRIFWHDDYIFSDDWCYLSKVVSLWLYYLINISSLTLGFGNMFRKTTGREILFLSFVWFINFQYFYVWLINYNQVNLFCLILAYYKLHLKKKLKFIFHKTQLFYLLKNIFFSNQYKLKYHYICF